MSDPLKEHPIVCIPPSMYINGQLPADIMKLVEAGYLPIRTMDTNRVYFPDSTLTANQLIKDLSR